MQTKRTYQIGDINTQKGFFETLIRLLDSKRMTCLPAIVDGFDRSTNMARVLPLVQFMVSTDAGEVPIDRPPCTVPVLQISRGGYVIDMPLFRGDTGLLLVMDRQSDTARGANSTRLWEPQDDDNKETIHNEGARPPDSFIYTSFEFGVFIPFAFGGSGLGGEEGIVIRRTMNPDTTEENQTEEENQTDSRDAEVRINNDGITMRINKDKVRFDKDGLSYEGENAKEFNVLTDARYLELTKSVEKKTRTLKRFGNFVVEVGEESGWIA